MLVIDGQLHSHAQRHSARDDGDFVQRVSILAQGGDERVPSLVISRDLLFVIGEQHRLAFGAHQDLVLGQLEVVHQHRLAIGTSGNQRSFIHHVGQISAGEAGCSASENRKIDIIAERNLPGMYAKDLFTSANIRTRDYHAAVETAGPQ